MITIPGNSTSRMAWFECCRIKQDEIVIGILLTAIPARSSSITCGLTSRTYCSEAMADLSGQGLSPCRREQLGAPDSYSGQVEEPAPLYHQAGYEHGADDRAFAGLICAQGQQKLCQVIYAISISTIPEIFRKSWRYSSAMPRAISSRMTISGMMMITAI